MVSVDTLRRVLVLITLIYRSRSLIGPRPRGFSQGGGNWFGTAGIRPGSRGYQRADLVLAHFYGPGRHLFLDVAVADPASGTALAHSPSSAASSGVAAQLRAVKKVAKYGPLAAAVSSSFSAAVLERYGACCDDLVGLIRMVCGDRDRDQLGEDYAFSTSSRVTYVASRVTFACALADASMVDTALTVDCAVDDCDDPLPTSVPSPSPVPARVLTSRPHYSHAADVLGEGGRFFYECALSSDVQQ